MTISLPTTDGTVEIAVGPGRILKLTYDCANTIVERFGESTVKVELPMLEVCALLAEAVAWQPVSDPPVDGRRVTAFIPSYGSHTAWFSVTVNRWWSNSEVVYPTHWRELPAVPQQEDKE